jgi:hypothetical protein
MILWNIAIVRHPNIGGVNVFRSLAVSAIAVFFLFVAAGCASLIEEHNGTTTVPEEPKKEVKPVGTAVGGFLGVFSADSIGQYTFEKKRTKEETEKKYGHRPSRGLLLRIENVSVVPNRVRAGEVAEIRMTYAVLGAPPRKELTVTETREIRYKGKVVGKPVAHVTLGDGTYSSLIPVTLPPGAKRGQYRVLLTVQTHKASASKEASFFVK